MSNLTEREYLQQNGYPVGKRGKFSGAQMVALREAAQKGIKLDKGKKKVLR